LPRCPAGALILATFDPTKCRPVVKELTIKFLRPAQSDITIEISMPKEDIDAIAGEIVNRGKAEFVLKGELKDTSGMVVAESRGLYQIRSSDKTWATMEK
jgi:hypothetical protein